MTEKPTPDLAYEQVWKPLIENSPDPEQAIKELLFDYGSMLADTSMLYTYLTEGLIENPQEPVEDVIEIADHLAAESIDQGIRDTLGLLLSLLDALQGRPLEEKYLLLVQSINELYELGHTDAES